MVHNMTMNIIETQYLLSIKSACTGATICKATLSGSLYKLSLREALICVTKAAQSQRRKLRA